MARAGRCRCRSPCSGSGEFTRVAGVLESTAGLGGNERAALVDVPLSGTVCRGGAADATARRSRCRSRLRKTRCRLSAAIAFALIGGVLLNLMPCVLPGAVAESPGLRRAWRQSRRDAPPRARIRAGVVVSFWLLAAALLALRAAGTQLGWGFQLQSPAVVAGLALLFFVLALNLSGLFEIRRLLPSSLAGWNAKNPYVNDALSGVLAVVVASPCSAPFMGAALGYALASSMGATWIVFTMLGVGMALPYLTLTYFPAWRSKLPQAWRMDAAAEAVAGISAVRDGDLAGLGARRAARQRRGRPARRHACCWSRWRCGRGRRCARVAPVAWGAVAIASLAAASIVGWPVRQPA